MMAGSGPLARHSAEIGRRIGRSFVMAELGSAIHDYV